MENTEIIELKKYPSIGQFRHTIKEVRERHDFAEVDENGDAVYRHLTDYPVLQFQGTVKLHGCNAGIIRYRNGTYQFQSRERILTIESDNYGFMNAMISKDLSSLFDRFACNSYVAIYGEWCGKGIQKGVAIDSL